MALSKRIKCFKYLVYSYVVLLTSTAAAAVLGSSSFASAAVAANTFFPFDVGCHCISHLGGCQYAVWLSVPILVVQFYFTEIYPANDFKMITGAAQIIIGTSLLWGHVGYYGIVQNKLWAPSAILLALGPFTFILCWMGCQATNQKKRCLLGMFSALLVAAICVQFIVCGWALAMRENLPTSVEIFVDDSFVDFLDKFSRTKVDNLHLWNRMQSQLQCCGVDGPLDYRRLSLPWSCCSRPEHAYESACDTHYKRGCLAVLSEQIKVRLLLACFAAAGIALVQSFGLFCAIHLTVLLGRSENGEDINRIAKRQQEFLPLSIQDKGRRDLPSPLSLSPSAPGHRLMKTAPPPPPTMPK